MKLIYIARNMGNLILINHLKYSLIEFYLIKSWFEKKLELEKQQILKHNEEIKNYQSKIKQLLLLLRQDQLKFKEEQFKVRKSMLVGPMNIDKTMIVYSKEIIDELKEEINILTAKLKESEDKYQKLLASISGTQQQNKNNTNNLNTNPEEYQSLLQRYNNAIERLDIVEKQLNTYDDVKSLKNSAPIESNTIEITNKIQELNDLDKENKNKLKEAAKKIMSLKEENAV